METQIQVKQWWFTADAGKLAVSVRYGSKVLELTKGKYAIEVAHEKDLAKTLDVIKSADYVIDLGPEGGINGGMIIAEGKPEIMSKSRKSYTAGYLKKALKA